MAALFPLGNLPANCISPTGQRNICLNVPGRDPTGAILIVANQAGHLLNCTEGIKNGRRYNIFLSNEFTRYKTIGDLFVRFQGLGAFPAPFYAVPPVVGAVPNLSHWTGTAPGVGINWPGMVVGQVITIDGLELNRFIVSLNPGFTSCPDFLDNYNIPYYNGVYQNPAPIPNGTITFRNLINPFLSNGPVHLISTSPSIINPVLINQGGDPFNDHLKIHTPGLLRGFIKGALFTNRPGQQNDYIPAPNPPFIPPNTGIGGTFLRNALPGIPAAETPLNCALREFFEETGTLLSTLYNLTPGLPGSIAAGAIDVNPPGHNINLPSVGGIVDPFNNIPDDHIYCLGNVTNNLETKAVYFIKASNGLEANILANYLRYQNKSEVFNLSFNQPPIANMNAFSQCAYQLLHNIFPGNAGNQGGPAPLPDCATPPLPPPPPPPPKAYIPPHRRPKAGGGSEEHFKQKYLKYKQKYMQLKNLI